jgi:hypothetical protein
MKIGTGHRPYGLPTLLLLGGVFLAAPSRGSDITLDAVNSGWYYKSGTANGSHNGIYSVNGVYRDWLGFDLSSIDEPIIGAVLEVKSNWQNQSGQLFNWWDVTTPYSSLGTSSLATYNDLGSGILFASGIHTAGTINSFPLNADALASLNASSSFWAVGGQNTVANAAFGWTSDYIKLVLTVQDPPPLNRFAGPASVPDSSSSLVLLGIGVFGVLSMRWFSTWTRNSPTSMEPTARAAL